MPKEKGSNDPTQESPVANDKSDVKVKSEAADRHIKYMGMSDVRVLNPGENIMGRAATFPLQERVEFRPDKTNGNECHVIHTSNYPATDPKFWDELLKLTDFKDVTEDYQADDRIPSQNAWQKVWGNPGYQDLNAVRRI